MAAEAMEDGEIAIGGFRIDLGVHWPSDVLASMLLGLSLLAVAWRIPVASPPPALRPDPGRG